MVAADVLQKFPDLTLILDVLLEWDVWGTKVCSKLNGVFKAPILVD